MNIRSYFLLSSLFSLSCLSHANASPVRPDSQQNFDDEKNQLKDMLHHASMQAKFEAIRRQQLYAERIKQIASIPQYLYKDLIGPIPEEQQRIFDLFLNRTILSKLGVELDGGIILAGPPGSGKSFFAEALAGELAQHGYKFYKQSAPTFNVGYAGEGTAYAAALFKHLRETATKENPIILYIDEIDSIAKTRGSFGSGSAGSDMHNTLNQILTEMADNNNKFLTVIVTTNRLSDLDSAFKRTGRMNTTLLFSLPKKEQFASAIKRFVKKYLIEWNFSLELVSIDELIKHEFTIQDLEEMFKYAAASCILDKTYSVKKHHYEKALETIKNKKIEDKKIDFKSTAEKMSKIMTLINQLVSLGRDQDDAMRLIQSWGYEGDLAQVFSDTTST